MKSICTENVSAPGGHNSQAIVPEGDLHFGFKLEEVTLAVVREA